MRLIRKVMIDCGIEEWQRTSTFLRFQIRALILIFVLEFRVINGGSTLTIMPMASEFYKARCVELDDDCPRFGWSGML